MNALIVLSPELFSLIVGLALGFLINWLVIKPINELNYGRFEGSK